MKDYAEVYGAHGAVSWTELMTSDPAAASGFYSQLFGWTVKTEAMPMGDYHVFSVGETSIGGIMAHPPGVQAPNGWTPYVTVKDVDAACAQATALGGKVVVAPMDVPKVGRMAVITDPQGAALNIITYSGM
jgi:predicted enzyme related to lactoylglutathione lyase